jgi:HEAT repeat protein
VLATLVGARAVVNVWLQGVTSPAWEALVNVVPEQSQDQVRAFLAGGPGQTGTAIAGLLALAGSQELDPRVVAGLGVLVAVITVVVAWRIRRSYTGALVEAMRAGRPTVFEGPPVEGHPIVVATDGQAVALAIGAASDPDVRRRRLAVEVLGEDVGDGRVADVLAQHLHDEDALIRAHAVRGLARAGRLSDDARSAALADPDPAVRLAGVEVDPRGPDPADAALLERATWDANPAVAAAASARLLGGPARSGAADRLAALLADPDPAVRATAVAQLRSAPPADAARLGRRALEDEDGRVRATAMQTLAGVAPDEVAAAALRDLVAEGHRRDVALDVLEGLDLGPVTDELSTIAEAHRARALDALALATPIPRGDPADELLRRALLERGRADGVVALSAWSLRAPDGDPIRLAIGGLGSAEPPTRATALETLEATSVHARVAPILALWDDTPEESTPPRTDWLDPIDADPDPTIRACVELVRATQNEGDEMARTRTSMSPMERVLALRGIALFAELTTADLRRLADIAEERAFAAEDVVSVEGEIGDELHLVVEGTILVTRGSRDAATVLAHRGAGEVVGEMSLITGQPRVASLVAEGDVRTLRIGRRDFESMIRERPDVALGVMRVLAQRLDVETRDRTEHAGGSR